MKQPDPARKQALFDAEARISWVLAGLAGLIGAAAFMHTAGYFVTFMTGNTERAVLGYFHEESDMAAAAAALLAAFLSGVVVASWCRRHFWEGHPHGPTLLTTVSLAVAALTDLYLVSHDDDGTTIAFVPILFVAFGVGALNTSFVKDGEVSIPLSYVTGTVVKMGQGIERHLSGGDYADWLNYFLLYTAFALGALIGGLLSLAVPGWAMLIAAFLVCLLTTGYTYLHLDRHGPLEDA
ncbi:YoaK family protein [Nocardia sp. NPDC050712]|uniref:YoaK family protein n=1 Tax=Nocardia sp. NPDC050712 TaxID=3155518 RepID=UPI0033EAFFAF